MRHRCDGTAALPHPDHEATMRHMWAKGQQYLKKMGGIILVASLIIWMLSYFPRPTEEQEATARTEMIQDGNTNVTPGNVTKVATTENSCLARLGKLVQPVFEPLGFNWKMTVSLISGTVAKKPLSLHSACSTAATPKTRRLSQNAYRSRTRKPECPTSPLLSRLAS